MDTNELIAKLSKEGPLKTASRSPAYFGIRLIAVLAAYALGAQFYLGLRPDIAVQITRLLFTVEILLLAALIFSSTVAAVFAMYPDLHQKPWMLKTPYAVFGALVALVLFQLFFMPVDPRMVFPPPGGHAMQCTLCIAAVSLVPSALIFGLLRKGASVHPFHAGSFAILAATGIGCVALRLAEANDSLIHLTEWHYLPTLLFAALGASIGKRLLKW